MSVVLYSALGMLGATSCAHGVLMNGLGVPLLIGLAFTCQ